MPAFVTEAYLKNVLPIGFNPGTFPAEPYLSELIQVASAYVQRYIDNVVTPTVIVERIKGSNSRSLVLDNYPVISLNAITGTRYMTVYTYSVNDFILDTTGGVIEWIDDGRYQFSKDTVYTVNYTAGYATIPREIVHATALQVIEMMNPMFNYGQQGQPGIIPETTQQFVDLLEPYRRKRFV
jgi:hypothetical protein